MCLLLVPNLCSKFLFAEKLSNRSNPRQRMLMCLVRPYKPQVLIPKDLEFTESILNHLETLIMLVSQLKPKL